MWFTEKYYCNNLMTFNDGVETNGIIINLIFSAMINNCFVVKLQFNFKLHSSGDSYDQAY